MHVSRRVELIEVASRSRRPRDPYRSGVEEIVLVLSRAATVLVLVIESRLDTAAQ